jgi:hypothetical protein
MMPNWKPAFIIKGEDKPSTNAQVFATREEALASAQDRFMRWTVPTDFTAVETEDPVNYTRRLGFDEMIAPEKVS